jgi:hypothetical protein
MHDTPFSNVPLGGPNHRSGTKRYSDFYRMGNFASEIQSLPKTCCPIVKWVEFENAGSTYLFIYEYLRPSRHPCAETLDRVRVYRVGRLCRYESKHRDITHVGVMGQRYGFSNQWKHQFCTHSP